MNEKPKEVRCAGAFCNALAEPTGKTEDGRVLRDKLGTGSGAKKNKQYAEYKCTSPTHGIYFWVPIEEEEPRNKTL